MNSRSEESILAASYFELLQIDANLFLLQFQRAINSCCKLLPNTGIESNCFLLQELSCHFGFPISALIMFISNKDMGFCPIGNWELGHLLDTLRYLATPTPKSFGLLITFLLFM